MTETKLHYKLYKTKHGWVTATIAATALAIPVIGGFSYKSCKCRYNCYNWDTNCY